MTKMSEEQVEPGYGWYADRGAHEGCYWEHGEEGWRYIDLAGSGSWMHWETVEPWGPFTPLNEERAEPAEPGYGRYADRDAREGCYWEHGEEGWRYTTPSGLSDGWVEWETVKDWGPFTPLTPLGEERAEPTERKPVAIEGSGLRMRALTLAVEAHRGEGAETERIVAMAQAFENYLKGEK